MIKICEIEIEGFGSIKGPITYNFNRSGLNLITGENGAGKTTFFNALSWVLYQKLLKNKSSFEPWPWLMGDNYQGTMVKVTLYKNETKYEIIRCYEYKGKILKKAGGNRLIILKDGVEFKGRNKEDSKKEIVNILGYTFDLFKSTVLFGQELKRLMDEDGPDKKKIFDEAFESTFIQRARDIVDIRVKESRGNRLVLHNKLEVTRTELNGINNQITQIKEIIQNWESQQQLKIDSSESEIRKLEASLKNVTLLAFDPSNANQIKSLNKELLKYQEDKSLKSEMVKYSSIKAVLGSDYKYQNKIVEELRGKKIQTICSTCKQSLNKDQVKEQEKKLRLELTKAVEKLDAISLKMEENEIRYKDLPKKIDAEDKKEGERKKLENQVRVLENKVAIYEREMQQFAKEISQEKQRLKELQEAKPLVNSPKMFYKKKRQIKESLTKLKLEHKQITKEIKVDEWLMNDPLSNSGLKAFIFDSMLSKVNNNLLRYKPMIGFEIKVYVDMGTAKKDISISIIKQGNEVPYEDLSKGQKQLVNASLAFACSDTIDQIKPINILLMDEIFENLSDGNVEIVGNIVSTKAKNKCLHLITHLNDFNPTNAYKVYVKLIPPGYTHIDQQLQQI